MVDRLREYIRGWDGIDVVPDVHGIFPRRASTRDPIVITIGKPKKPTVSRLLFKDGSYTLIPKNIPNLTVRFINDFWNTMLDMKWIAILVFFLISNLSVWLVFTGVFWTISYAHGDFDPVNQADPAKMPCIFFENNGTSFAAVFLFSVETLRTIGYGTPRYPTEECGATVFFLCFSCIISVLLEAVLVGLLLAKTHVPQQRTSTLLFTKVAAVCTRNNQMCLIFRIGNVRSSLLLRVVLKAFLVYAKKTSEGEEMPFHQHEIKLQIDENGDNVYLGWPITACHVIDSSSPFYHLSKKNLERAAFEIIVILEGIVESTGASIQARTSYVPDEIRWATRFESIYKGTLLSGEQYFDFQSFDTTVPQPEMRDLSAYEHDVRASLSAPPEIFVIGGDDQLDSGDHFHELGDHVQMLSPSLAKALDIPYELLQSRSRRGSYNKDMPGRSRRNSRMETRSESLRIAPPVHAVGSPPSPSNNVMLRRIATARPPVRLPTIYDPVRPLTRTASSP